MSINKYYDSDCNLGMLDGKTVAVIGFGSQGHAHSENLAESGVNVVVGLRKGSAHWEKASEFAATHENFKVMEVEEAAKAGDVVMMLVPDELCADIYNTQVAPYMTEGKALAFAHGFNIHFKTITPPKNVDVIMIAPKGPGHIVRRLYTEGEGCPSRICVEQDYTGKAKDIALAYASGIGAGASSTAPSSDSHTTGPNGVISISGNAVVNATGKFYGIGAYKDDGNGALVISGGTVTARATDEKASDSCGIGRIERFTVSGGTVNASGYTGIYSATVNGGVVTAESRKSASGFGTLISGGGRNGWVVSKPAQAAHRMASGVLFSGDEGKIIGEYCELPASLREIPAGAALTVDAGQELLVPAGGTLRVSGKLIANGKLVVEGTLDTAAGGEVEVNGESNITGSITGNRLPLVIQTKDETTEATSFDVSTLFTIPANAGAVSYTVTGRNGASGKLDGTIFTVENGGVFEVKASVQESAHYQAAEATALLTARNGSQPHVHVKIEFEAKAPDCLNPGNIRYWACENCGKCFSDESCETEISYESTILPATGHKFENGACTVCGAEDPSYAGTAVIEVGSLTAYPGDTIEIPVSLRNNPGVTSFKLTVHYDDTLLSYQSLAFDETLTAIEGSKTLVNAEQSGQVTLTWVATGSNYSGSGNVAGLTFKVNAAQENTNTQLSVTYDEDDVFNIDFVNQHFLAKAGSVQVNTVRPGDINGDGKVDAMDAMLLLHYVCGLKQNEVKGNPDVNGDGKTNNKDVVILLRYVAGWEGITLH